MSDEIVTKKPRRKKKDSAQEAHSWFEDWDRTIRNLKWNRYE